MDACYYKVEDSDTALTDEQSDLLKAMHCKDACEILDVAIDGKKAVVKVKASKDDFGEAVKEMSEVMKEKIRSGEVVESNLKGNDYINVLKECLRKDDAKLLTDEYEIKCILVKNKWYLDSEDTFFDDFVLKAQNKPEDVVGQYLDAVRIFDTDAMDECYFRVAYSEGSLSDSEIDLLNAMYGKLSYEILSVDIDGTNAVVKVKASKADYAANVVKMTNMLLEKIESGELKYDDLTDEDYLDVLKECLRSDDVTMLTKEFDVKCNCIGTKWFLDGEDSSLEDFLNEGLDLD